MTNIAAPIITDNLDDILAVNSSDSTTIDLFNHFDDPFTTGLVARFELYDQSLAGGVTEVLLFDQAEAGAPLTVANFSNYVNDGDYVNSIIHRSVPGFIVQGGGFTVENLTVDVVPTDEPVQNEFSVDRSNIRGTIAMAKEDGDPDSATSQWFFNLDDNGANLDNQNGGFTVFGEVLNDDDLAVLDAIATVPISQQFSSPFQDLPLIGVDTDNDVSDLDEITSDENFVRYQNISLVQRDELTFEVISNSNPSLVDVSINDENLLLDYQSDQLGTADVTVRATNLVGELIEDTFTITVEEGNEAPTAIALDNNNIDENSTSDTVIGTLTTTDPDVGDSHTYELIENAGGRFTINNDELTVADGTLLDFDTNTNHSITVRTTDSQGLLFEQQFIIEVNDVNEDLPTIVSGTPDDDNFDATFPTDKEFVGESQIVNTGSGSDQVNLTYAPGDNTVQTNSGDDIIFAGTNDRIDAGTGDDLIFLGSDGGNNLVTGGEGADIFYLTQDDDLLPANPNIIGDYNSSEADKIGFLATSLEFGSSELNFRQDGLNTVIEAFGQDVAILNNIDALSLTEDNFVFNS